MRTTVPCPDCGNPAKPVMGIFKALKPVCDYCEGKISLEQEYWYVWLGRSVWNKLTDRLKSAERVEIEAFESIKDALVGKKEIEILRGRKEILIKFPKSDKDKINKIEVPINESDNKKEILNCFIVSIHSREVEFVFCDCECHLSTDYSKYCLYKDCCGYIDA